MTCLSLCVLGVEVSPQEHLTVLILLGHYYFCFFKLQHLLTKLKEPEGFPLVVEAKCRVRMKCSIALISCVDNYVNGRSS